MSAWVDFWRRARGWLSQAPVAATTPPGIVCGAVAYATQVEGVVAIAAQSSGTVTLTAQTEGTITLTEC